MQQSSAILIMSVVSLLIGLALYIWARWRSNNQRFFSTALVSWLFIALFPVILIFSFFPGSTTSGNIFGFSVTGAIAAFILIWWRGTASFLKAEKLDHLEEKVHTLESELEKSKTQQDPKILSNTEIFTYNLRKNNKKKIGLITGNIESVTIADAWVSSENANMEMSRYFEPSISGVIRYYGAKKDPVGNVTEDTIANALRKAKGDTVYMPAASVLTTTAGELQQTHNVKKIFHVAAVQGEVGVGYYPIHNIQLCVTNTLKKVDSADMEDVAIKKILFPLFGAGTAHGDLEEIATKLIQTAITYMETHSTSSLEHIYFLTWTDREFNTCREILQQSNKVD